VTADTPVLARIEPMRPEHVDAVAAIEAGWQSRPWSSEVFRSELAREDRAYRVALAGPGVFAEVVGYGGITVAAGEAHVLTIAVAPAHRRRGTGRRLLLALVAAARERGAEAVTLEVRESNHAAAAMYAELGFTSSGIRPGYYPDTGEGARILWLHDLADLPIPDEES
jgi:ribosomal-protein-alanine N-acetyltransferase